MNDDGSSLTEDQKRAIRKESVELLKHNLDKVAPTSQNNEKFAGAIAAVAKKPNELTSAAADSATGAVGENLKKMGKTASAPTAGAAKSTLNAVKGLASATQSQLGGSDGSEAGSGDTAPGAPVAVSSLW